MKFHSTPYISSSNLALMIFHTSVYPTKRKRSYFPEAFWPRNDDWMGSRELKTLMLSDRKAISDGRGAVF